MLNAQEGKKDTREAGGDIRGRVQTTAERVSAGARETRERVTEATPYAYRHFGSFRLLLASLVMFHHYSQDLAPEPFPRRSIPFQLGSIAVLAFFALSGFVITEAVDRVYSGKPIAFISNRVLRIVPHFVLAVAVSVLLHKLFVVEGDVGLSPRASAFLFLDFPHESPSRQPISH